MSHDILQPIPQGGYGAQDAENSRIAEIANELERLCRLHETQSGTGKSDVVFMALLVLTAGLFYQSYVNPA